MEKTLKHRRRTPSPIKPHERVSRRAAREEQGFMAWLGSIQATGMYPLDAPGMPLPGPDFLRHAIELGDTESELFKVQVEDDSKKSGKRTETHAKIGHHLTDLYRKALRTPGFTLPVEIRGGATKEVVFIPGHIWNQYFDDHKKFDEPRLVDGPHPSEVMVLGKMPGVEEAQHLRNLIGATGEVLHNMIQELKISGTKKWYVTNLLKFRPPDGSSNIKAGWLKDCLPLLHQELRIVQPKYILCLGADASTALLGSKCNVSYMDGRVLEFTYPTGLAHEEPRPHTALVMTVIHPAQVARDQSLGRQLERGMARFNLLKQGIRFDKEEHGIDHTMVDNLEDLAQRLYEIENDPAKKDSIIAMDGEWEGEHPCNKGSYLRTIQFSWLPKHALAIKLRHAGGAVAFVDEEGKPAVKQMVKLMKVFIKGGTWRNMKFRRKRVVGHFFNSDLEWLVNIGLDIRAEFAVPLHPLDLTKQAASEWELSLHRLYRRKGYKKLVPAWVRTRYEGGADTGLMAHAIEESANYKLETLAMRYTTVPRYDVALQEWKEQFCKERGITASALEGYGNCPDEILVPYGCYDADATLRLYYIFSRYLDLDYDGNCCREAFWENQIAAPPVLEIHTNGICVDRDRIDYLTQKFLAARIKQEAKIKRWARWPDFNIRSVQHVKEFLFGEDYNGKVSKDGSITRIRPKRGSECGFCEGNGRIHKDEKVYRCKMCEGSGRSPGAYSLKLQPLFDTSKPPKLWAEIVDRHAEREHSPSTNKAVLAILAQENEKAGEQVNWIRDYRFTDQVLKTILRPPKADKEGNWLYEPEVGDGGTHNLIYDAGLASVICDDGRVRTHIYQTKETGRWASARPNLQNISKARDDDYKRLLGAVRNEKGKWVGGDYIYPLRSVLRASPGHLLVEADYVGAELYGMAIMSGDATMIDHATRNQLPESHKDYYDIHSNVAVLAFRLRCPPTKKGLDDIGKSKLRIVAKSVIFGIAYGRGAKAIAMAAKEQGIQISVDDAQRIIDTIFEMYPGLVPFFEEAKRRSRDERWLCHCFGRFRRFPMASDRGMAGEFERQAMNFPIQGMIASAVDRGIAYLYDYRESRHLDGLFRILLQIHDAILLEVPYRHVEFVTQRVIPWAMREMVPIYPTTLDGRATGKGPYFLGIDVEVMEHWGQKLTVDQAKTFGLPTQKWSGNGVSVAYCAG